MNSPWWALVPAAMLLALVAVILYANHLNKCARQRTAAMIRRRGPSRKIDIC